MSFISFFLASCGVFNLGNLLEVANKKKTEQLLAAEMSQLRGVFA